MPPHLVKNLVSMRKLTTNNFVSVEFDPFGFCVKDLQKGNPLMRCKSIGDLYPIPSSPTSSLSPAFAFAVLPSSLWHSRLGHPGKVILDSLNRTC